MPNGGMVERELSGAFFLSPPSPQYEEILSSVPNLEAEDSFGILTKVRQAPAKVPKSIFWK